MNSSQSIELHWLGQAPSLSTGVTWGVPWAEGVLQRDDEIALTGSDGTSIPVQSWPAAYWSDGSVKWTAHAISIQQEVPQENYFIHKASPAIPKTFIKVKEMEEKIEVDTGLLLFRLGKAGSSSLIHSINRGENQICSNGKLICIREEQFQAADSKRTRKEEVFESRIFRTVVEQEGPIRAVIRFEGKHQMASGDKAWLPFIMRIIFYAGQESFDVVHTFLYDGNPNKDFVKGLGLSFNLPMHGPLYNRHVRIAGDTGFFSESPKNLATSRTFKENDYLELYRKQFSGEYIDLSQENDEWFIDMLDDAAIWNDFKIVQDSADHYFIRKRTNDRCSWLKSGEGHRAGGLLYAGSEVGGMAVGMKNFWQKYPSSIEVKQMAHEEAVLKVWFWSPDAESMDLRHYDTATHVQSSYEGFEEMRSTPYGIANTNELRIWCLESTPNLSELNKLTEHTNAINLLCCKPEYYQQVKAFGIWSLEDRSTPLKEYLEEQLDAVIQFYKDEIEQRRWYGFWDYGDVMHTYDPVRHTWRYDMGGFAWQNTELVPNMWLWYMFLRSGREDVFKLAEAMTRHTSEVDVYHIGEYAGLGSRHNVVHWGCGCKEARISMAGLHRFYYYLTADERIGDILDEVKDADYSTVHMNPMRAILPKDEYPTHARVGPDWAAFSSNWLVQWERYEDTNYRDKIRTGIECLKRMPYRMQTLAAHGYDPKTGMLYFTGKSTGSHLAISMGGPQIWIELVQMLKDPEWENMLAEIGAFYHLSKDEKRIKTEGIVPGRGYGMPLLATGITAFAASHFKDKDLARLTWRILLNNTEFGQLNLQKQTVGKWEHINVEYEVPWISTNIASQWALNTILCLELIGDELPNTKEELLKDL